MSDSEAWIALLSALVAAGLIKHIAAAVAAMYNWLKRLTPEGQARKRLEIQRIEDDMAQGVIDRLAAENRRAYELIETERELWQAERERLTKAIERLEQQVVELRRQMESTV